MKSKLIALIIIIILIVSAILAQQAYSQQNQAITNRVEVGQSTSFNEVSVASFTPETGWSFQYNINSRLVTTSTVAGTVTMANSMAVLSTGAGANQSATMRAIRKIRHISGYGGLVRFTALFTDCATGSEQIIGLGDENEGLFFGCNGNEFGIMRRSNGVDTWTAKRSWSGSPNTSADLINNLDVTKGNVYQIQFQWGYGEIRFFIEDPDTGKLAIVHRIQYANKNTVPSIINPHLPLYANVANTSNTSDIVLKTPSGIGGLEGQIPNAVNPFTLSNSQVVSKSVGAAMVNILTISNTEIFQGVSNTTQIQPAYLTIATDGNKSVSVNGYVNAALGGTPSFTAIDADTSIAFYDTAGTTVTGGTLFFSIVAAKTDTIAIDLHQFGIFLNPGDTLTIAAQSATLNQVEIGLAWHEHF